MKVSWHSPMGAPLMRELVLLIVCAFSIITTAHAQADFEWIPVNEGLEGDVVPVLWQSPAGYIYAGGIGGLFRSKGYLEPWEATGLVGFEVGVVSSDSENNILAGTREGLYKSSDQGQNWELFGYYGEVYDIALLPDSSLAIATPEGILRKSPKVSNWVLIGQWFENGENVANTSIAVTDDGRLWTNVQGAVYYTQDLQDWQCLTLESNCVSFGADTRNIEAVGDNILVSTWNHTFRYSADSAEISPTSLASEVLYYVRSNEHIYAITQSKSSASGPFPNALFSSNDQGESWSRIKADGAQLESAIVSADDSWICIGQRLGISCSEDSGNNWSKWNNGLSNTIIPSLFTTFQGEIIAGAIEGAFILDRSTDRWLKLNLNPAENDFKVAISSFTQSSSGLIVALGGWIYRSFDGGYTWDRAPTEFYTAGKLSSEHSVWFHNTLDVLSSVFPYATPCPYTPLLDSPAISFGDTLGYLGSLEFNRSVDDWETAQVYRSIQVPGSTDWQAITFTSDSNLLVGSTEAVLLRSKNGGVSWSLDYLVDDSEVDINGFEVLTDGTILASSNYGVFFSTNNGYDWELSGIEKCTNSLKVGPENILLADGKYVSKDNGSSWVEIPTPPAPVITTTFSSDGTPYVGTYGLGVFKGNRPISLSSNSNENIASAMIEVFPNPAINYVTIRISIGKSEFVTAVIYDLLGRQLRTLADQYGASGNGTLHLDLPDLPGGMYIISIKAGLYVRNIPLFLRGY